MKKRYLPGRLVVGLMALVFIASCAEKRVLNPPPELIGHWKGNDYFYQVPVKKPLQKYYVEYELEIEPDGRITGVIGHASIEETYLVRTSAVLRLLGNGEYRSNLKLRGQMDPNEEYSDGHGVFFVGEITGNTMASGINTYVKLRGKTVRVMFNRFFLTKTSVSL